MGLIVTLKVNMETCYQKLIKFLKNYAVKTGTALNTAPVFNFNVAISFLIFYFFQIIPCRFLLFICLLRLSLSCCNSLLFFHFFFCLLI